MIRVAVFVVFLVVLDASAEPIDRGRIAVVDGDTIRVAREVVRLVGFNTPETRGAEGPAERRAGLEATRRLRQLVAGGGLDLTFVRCACAPGTEGTPACCARRGGTWGGS